MKTGLVYIFGVIFALLVFSSTQNNERDSFEVETCQSVVINYNSDCLISEFNFSFRNLLETVTLLSLESTYITESSYRVNENILSTFYLLFQKKSLGIKQLIKKPFRIILFFTSDNSDSYSLQ